MKWVYYALMAMFLQGTTIFLVKTQLSNNNPYSVLFFQYIFGLSALSSYFLFKKENIFIGKKNVSLAILSGFFVSIGLISYYLAINETALSIVAPVRGTGFILLTSIMGITILKEKLSLKKIMGVIFCILSIIFLTI
ncbi:MAG: EamA family transporter [Candidatus Nanoarchaeia archaeon]|nr:EamA family transporter [Candidatus Nanoarchaeia archaeon]MDD5054329.1 EamA family transporter [Candidatus Nanoarchaeia archaeon]MDD5499334.1 EamA family transporter [Candidatus Nanoarchaeia archaeon]